MAESMDQDVGGKNLPKSCSTDLGDLGDLGFLEEGLAPRHLNMLSIEKNIETGWLRLCLYAGSPLDLRLMAVSCRLLPLDLFLAQR